MEEILDQGQKWKRRRNLGLKLKFSRDQIAWNLKFEANQRCIWDKLAIEGPK
jgi:hypothetical protein